MTLKWHTVWWLQMYYGFFLKYRSKTELDLDKQSDFSCWYFLFAHLLHLDIEPFNQFFLHTNCCEWDAFALLFAYLMARSLCLSLMFLPGLCTQCGIDTQPVSDHSTAPLIHLGCSPLWTPIHQWRCPTGVPLFCRLPSLQSPCTRLWRTAGVFPRLLHDPSQISEVDRGAAPGRCCRCKLLLHLPKWNPFQF